jgi:uncharacterized membrane protein
VLHEACEGLSTDTCRGGFCWIESALSAGTELMIPTRAVLLHKLLRSGWCVAVVAMAIATLVEWGLMAVA